MVSKRFIVIAYLLTVSVLTLTTNTTRASELEGNESLEIKPTDAEVSAIIDKTLGDHAAYQTLLSNLKEAVAADDRQRVSGLMSYPLDAEIDGNEATIDGASMFLAFYDKIMIPQIITAIQETAYSDVLVSYDGVMLGEGQVWINAICKNETCSDIEVLVSTLQKGPD